MRHQKHPQQQDQTLQERAAHIAFPDWQPHPDDWVSLYTRVTDDGPVTEVAVYRGRERIHYRTYSGPDLQQFWSEIMRKVSE